ncbi:MAG TPA: YfhO family protein, partial [Pyrinomonadaceae bacterium]|nr:YfhO family protein [Pyrinomonadaceae bacterium]
KIRHRLAPVATSAAVVEPPPVGTYQSHTYVTSFELPERVTVIGLSVEVLKRADAPKLGLGVQRVSLIDEQTGETVPLTKRWLKTEDATRTDAGAAPADAPGAGATGASASSGTAASDSENVAPAPSARWRRLAQAGDVIVYENTRALPRAWLADEVFALPDEAALEVIRTGKLPDGRAWEPLSTALVDARPPELDAAPLKNSPGEARAPGRAEVKRHEPNRVDLLTSAPVPTVLVLSENHYPGWRAYVDGRAVETMRVNYNLRGVALPPGEHEVRFLYRPKSVYFGLLVSLLAAAGLGVWVWRAPKTGQERTSARENLGST